MLRFSDGMTFNTQGAFRAVKKSDGWYVVGRGWLVPVESREEAEKWVAEWNEKEKRNG